MGIAFSNKRIVYSTTVRGDTVANLKTDLHGVFSQVMPTFSSITGGHSYDMVSPQTLSAKLLIYDSAGQVVLQLTNVSGSLVGYPSNLSVTSGRFFQVWANLCQGFISVNGVNATGGTAAQFGIPFVGQAKVGCDLTGDGVVNEAWWSCSDNISNGGFHVSFRNNFRPNSQGLFGFSACYNGDLMNWASRSYDYGPIAALQLVPIRIAMTDRVSPSRTRLYRAPGDTTTDDTLYLDPILAWGSGSDTNSIAKYRGLLWDATLPSQDKALDSEVTIDRLTFVNYLHQAPGDGDGSKWGSLYLLKTKPSGFGAGNYAY